MTTSERAARLSTVFNGRMDLGLKSAGDLRDLVESELGHCDILDRPLRMGSLLFQARAPDRIYHICASNLAVSAETSLLLGLLIGSKLDFKLPASGLPQFVKTIDLLPAEFRDTVRLFTRHNIDEMKQADAVVVYGNDATIREIQAQCMCTQRFLGYGHKISLGVIFDHDLTPSTAAKASAEILAYEQLGCLSPQAYLCQSHASAMTFSELLAAELIILRRRFPMPPPTLEQSALYQDYVNRAFARGEQVTRDDKADYAVIAGGLSLVPGPGHGCIQVMAGIPQDDLKQWTGKISSVSFTSTPERNLADFFVSLGVSRFCRTGELQNPPLAWRHDGRPRLADLVTWVTFEL